MCVLHLHVCWRSALLCGITKTDQRMNEWMNSCDYQQIMIHGEPLGKILPNIYQIKFKSHVSGMYYMLYVLLPDHLIKNKIKRRERERDMREVHQCASVHVIWRRDHMPTYTHHLNGSSTSQPDYKRTRLQCLLHIRYMAIWAHLILWVSPSSVSGL